MMKLDSFKSLQKEHLFVSLTLSIVMLCIYFGFILLLAFNKKWLTQTIGSTSLTIALPIGVGIIVIAWVLTGIYVVWANKRYDKQVQAIKKLLP